MQRLSCITFISEEVCSENVARLSIIHLSCKSSICQPTNWLWRVGASCCMALLRGMKCHTPGYEEEFLRAWQTIGQWSYANPNNPIGRWLNNLITVPRWTWAFYAKQLYKPRNALFLQIPASCTSLLTVELVQLWIPKNFLIVFQINSSPFGNDVLWKVLGQIKIDEICYLTIWGWSLADDTFCRLWKCHGDGRFESRHGSQTEMAVWVLCSWDSRSLPTTFSELMNTGMSRWNTLIWWSDWHVITFRKSLK
jgi:hypothetical protein